VPEEYRLRDQEPRPEKTLDPRHDGYTLSGDANLLHSRWELRYTIADPEAYAFGFSRPEEILRKELDHAVAMTSARYTIDEALRTDIEAFRSDVDHEVRRRIEQLGLGARVQRVDLVTVRPPRQVAEAFDAVVQAEQESSRRNSDARAYASRTLNEARGDAARLVSEGKAYKKRLVNEARANAEYFEAVYEKYVRNPHITARTLLQDTLRRSLANVEEKYVIYRSGADDQEFRLQLSPKAKQRNPSQ
jgi:membrane protease subunit HflK